jgi:hypothetical protein
MTMTLLCHKCKKNEVEIYSTNKQSLPLLRAPYPFYVKMFTNAGFPTTIGSAAPDSLVDSMVISGDEHMVTARFSELLASGLDELMVTLMPIIDTDNEQFRLHSIG